MKPVSVSQVNSYIKRTLAVDPILSNITVKGEISKLTFHSSGHVYFTLKDETSRLNCFLPADRAELLRFELDEGMQILASGSVSVYEKGGYYSLNVRLIEAEGEGALAIAFEKLKNRLAAEGLFDEAHKKSIPRFPKRIGVVTSPTGAAVHDIITTLKRRNPLVDVFIYPCIVQGDKGAASVAEGIRFLNENYPSLDLMIVGRGGGSKEDLWCFNEELTARAVYASKIPVISAVGHEVDFTICDFAADLRGATPTAAAELATDDIRVYAEGLEAMSKERLSAILDDRISFFIQRIEALKVLQGQSLDLTVKTKENSLKLTYQSLFGSVSYLITETDKRLQVLMAELEGLDPKLFLKRGYTYVTDGENRQIASLKDLSKGQRIRVIFSDGTANCLVEDIENGKQI